MEIEYFIRDSMYRRWKQRGKKNSKVKLEPLFWSGVKIFVGG